MALIKFDIQWINSQYPAGGYLIPSEGRECDFVDFPNLRCVYKEASPIDSRIVIYHLDSGTSIATGNSFNDAHRKANIRLQSIPFALLQKKIHIANMRKMKFLAYRKKHKLDW